MALTTSIGVITYVHDYLNRPSDERLQIFTETITDINHAHAYWYEFTKISTKTLLLNGLIRSCLNYVQTSV